MYDRKSLYYCPYVAGILVTKPDVSDSALNSSQAQFFDRRSGKDRRVNKGRSQDRRTMNFPVCPAYGSEECSYNLNPDLRPTPKQMLVRCHSKSGAPFLYKTPGTH